MVIMGVLASFGALCALWLTAGGLLPGGQDGVTVYTWRDSAAGRGFVIRWRLQWDLGLLRLKLVVIAPGLTEEDRRFLARWGRNVRIVETDYGTGT